MPYYENFRAREAKSLKRIFMGFTAFFIILGSVALYDALTKDLTDDTSGTWAMFVFSLIFVVVSLWAVYIGRTEYIKETPAEQHRDYSYDD